MKFLCYLALIRKAPEIGKIHIKQKSTFFMENWIKVHGWERLHFNELRWGTRSATSNLTPNSASNVSIIRNLHPREKIHNDILYHCKYAKPSLIWRHSPLRCHSARKKTPNHTKTVKRIMNPGPHLHDDQVGLGMDQHHLSVDHRRCRVLYNKQNGVLHSLALWRYIALCE